MEAIGALEWEESKCPLCGDRGAVSERFTLGVLGNLPAPWVPPQGYHIEHCRSCHLHFLQPRLQRRFMERFYQDMAYFTGDVLLGYRNYEDQEATLRLTSRIFLKKLSKRGLTGGSVAEIGCGLGYFLLEAAKYFERRVGADLCESVGSRVRGMGCEFVCGGPLDILDRCGGGFDLVVAVGVLEHVYDPVFFVRSCQKLLGRTARLVLVAPDWNGPWRRILGRAWPSFKLPEHIAYYDERSIVELARRSGMVYVTKFGFAQVFPLGLVAEKVSGRPWTCRGPGALPVYLPAVMTAFVLRPRDGI